MASGGSNAVTQDLLKEKALQAQQIDSVFHLDLKMDNLKGFLQNISVVINQQSVLINQLQAEMKTKITVDRVEKALKTVSQSIEIQDPELQKKVQPLLDKPRVENTGDPVTDGTHMICNKIVQLGAACSLLHKGNKDWEQKLTNLQNEIGTKVTKEALKLKVRKAKGKLQADIDEFKKKSQKQIDDSIKKNATEMGRLEISIKDTEKKTLWKISDCESLLQKRVTSDYVDSTSKSLEEKLRREIMKMKDDSFGDIHTKLVVLNDRCKNIEDQMQEKQKGVKKMMKDLEDDLMKKFCPTEKFETNKKVTLDKLVDLDSKIALLDRRGSALELSEKLTKMIKEIEEKMGALQREDAHLKNAIQDLTVKIELAGKKGEGEEGVKVDGDPHRICALETELKRQKDDITDLKRLLKNIEEDLRRKFENLEHKVLGQFQNMKKGESGVTKEEASVMTERVKIWAEEKMRLMAQELDELRVKCGGLGDLEKRLKKKLRDLQDGGGVNQDWAKLLENKAEVDDTRREFLLVDEKIRSVSEIVNQFRREFEAIEEFYMQLAAMLKNNQQETISIITGNQRIIPNRCVACGTKGKQLNNTSDMKGSDGRIYRADYGANHQTSVYENQEVFDVLPSHIGLPNINFNDQINKSSLSVNKQSVVSFKGRPTSAAATVAETMNVSNLQQSFMSQKGNVNVSTVKKM